MPADSTLMATDSQLSFLRDLLSQVEGKEQTRRALNRGEHVSRREASELIEALLARRSASRASRGRPSARTGITTGMYMVDGNPVKVFRARNGRHLLAKKLRNGGWEYLGAAGRFVQPDQKMTLEEASAYGRRTGRCCSCGRTLTNPNSIAEGIGPICAEGF